MAHWSLAFKLIHSRGCPPLSFPELSLQVSRKSDSKGYSLQSLPRRGQWPEARLLALVTARSFLDYEVSLSNRPSPGTKVRHSAENPLE